MTIQIWLDDIREMPKGFTHHCKKVDFAINLFLGDEEVEFISFDHDLGENQKTGYDLAVWIERGVYMEKFKPPRWAIHSSNPVGIINITAAMVAATRFYIMKQTEK